MIGRLSRGSQEDTLTAQVTHNSPGQPHRDSIAFESKWHSVERWVRARHECHQGMNRGRRRTPLSQRIEFAAEQGAAGMKNKSDSSLPGRRHCIRRPAYLAIRNAKPQEIAIERRSRNSGRVCTDPAAENLRTLARTRWIAAHDLRDRVAGFAQCRRQNTCQPARANDSDPGLASHARKNTIRRRSPAATRRRVRVILMPMAKTKRSRRARTLSSRVTFKGPVFYVTTDQVEEPGGIRARRDVIRHSGSVVVLAVDDRGRVLLERQYRHAAQSMMWELPAGRIDEGESALTGARRELLEETGFTARNWKKILHFYVSPGFLDETMTIFLARELHAGESQPEPDERITVRFVPLSAAVRMVLRGSIRDAKTISGILWLARQSRRNR